MTLRAQHQNQVNSSWDLATDPSAASGNREPPEPGLLIVFESLKIGQSTKDPLGLRSPDTLQRQDVSSSSFHLPALHFPPTGALAATGATIDGLVDVPSASPAHSSSRLDQASVAFPRKQGESVPHFTRTLDVHTRCQRDEGPPKCPNEDEKSWHARNISEDSFEEHLA